MVYNMSIFGENKYFTHSKILSRDHVTSQENWPWEDFHLGKNGKPITCGVQKTKISDGYFFNLKIVSSP